MSFLRKKWFLFLPLLLIIALLSSSMVSATSYYDTLAQTAPNIGSFNQCVWYRFNMTDTMSITGFTKNATATSTRGFLVVGNIADPASGNCQNTASTIVASCTFSGDSCTFNVSTSITAGQNFTIAMDNNDAVWTQRYGSVASMPADGNTSILRWLGAKDNGGGSTVDGLSRSISGVYFNDGQYTLTVSANNSVNGSTIGGLCVELENATYSNYQCNTTGTTVTWSTNTTLPANSSLYLNLTNATMFNGSANDSSPNAIQATLNGNTREQPDVEQ